MVCDISYWPPCLIVDIVAGAWPGAADSGSAAEPTAMETNSPWESSAPPPAAPREGWASFEKPAAESSSSEQGDNWADFSSFSDLSGYVAH